MRLNEGTSSPPRSSEPGAALLHAAEHPPSLDVPSPYTPWTSSAQSRQAFPPTFPEISPTHLMSSYSMRYEREHSCQLDPHQVLTRLSLGRKIRLQLNHIRTLIRSHTVTPSCRHPRTWQYIRRSPRLWSKAGPRQVRTHPKGLCQDHPAMRFEARRPRLQERTYNLQYRGST